MWMPWSAVLVIAATLQTADVDARPQASSAALEQRAAIEALLAEQHFSEAENRAKQWLAGFDAQNSAPSLDLAYALDSLVQALAHTNKAGGPESIEIAQRAIVVKRQVTGDASLEYAETLSHAARMLDNGKRFQEASEAARTALAIQLPVVDRAAPRVRALATQNLLGAARHGAWPNERRSSVERAVSIAEADGDKANLADGLGQMTTWAGDESERRALRRRVLALRVELGVRNLAFVQALANVAADVTWNDDPADAQEILLRHEQALEELRPVIDSASPVERDMYRSSWDQLGGNLTHLADRLLKLGRYEAALAAVDHGVAIIERTFTAENFLRWQPGVLMTTAHAAAGSGQFDRAFAAALDSEAARTTVREETIRTASERSARLIYAWGDYGPDVAVSLLLNGQIAGTDAIGLAWTSVLQSRGLIAEALEERYRVVHSAQDPELEGLAAAAREAREKFVNLVLASAQPSREDPVLRASLEERDAAERNLAMRVQTARQVPDQAPIDLGRISAALPPDTALVAFRIFKRFHWQKGTAPGQSAGDGDAYAAFVLQAGAAPRVVDLGPAAPIHRLVFETSAQLEEQAASALGPSRMLEQAYRSTAGRLRSAIWDPLVPFLGNAKRIFIVPDGAIHLVDFAALPTGQDRYLVEDGRPIHYVAAERQLARLPEAGSTGDLLAVGAPEADPTVEVGAAPAFRGGRAACGVYRDLSFEALPGAARELRDVTSTWRTGTTGKATLLGGGSATEAEFKAQAPGKRVLHLATHGFFLAGPCGADFNRRFDWKDLIFSDVDITNDNPLLLSGLVMAMPARPGEASAGDDGVLTAEEIEALDLGRVEWAVLSACDTGLGKVKEGEGMFGLRQAFQVAGVHTVIMSLWQIEDEAAERWMQRLYQRRFVDHLDTADSVHFATLDVLRARRAAALSTHPVYWAGFVASGDWR